MSFICAKYFLFKEKQLFEEFILLSKSQSQNKQMVFLLTAITIIFTRVSTKDNSDMILTQD